MLGGGGPGNPPIVLVYLVGDQDLEKQGSFSRMYSARGQRWYLTPSWWAKGPTGLAPWAPAPSTCARCLGEDRQQHDYGEEE